MRLLLQNVKGLTFLGHTVVYIGLQYDRQGLFEAKIFGGLAPPLTSSSSLPFPFPPPFLHVSRCCPSYVSPILFPTPLYPDLLLSLARRSVCFPRCPAKKWQPVAKVGGDQIHSVPVISKVGGDASHGSRRVVAPMTARPTR